MTATLDDVTKKIKPGSRPPAWCVKATPRDSQLGLYAVIAVRVTSSAAVVGVVPAARHLARMSRPM
jgi:hypothetical protein